MGWCKWASDNVTLQSRDRCRIPFEGSIEEARHGAFCNFCSRTIYGIRFKCQSCLNLDCCLGCLVVATAHDTGKPHQLLPIVDPEIDALPGCVPLFQTVQDANLAYSHRNGSLGPESVLSAKYNGEEWAQDIRIIWLPRERSKMVEQNGVILSNVAAEDPAPEAATKPQKNPSPKPRELCVHQEFPQQPTAMQEPVVDRPISFYESVVLAFQTTMQSAETPIMNCSHIYQYEPLDAERTIRVLKLWPGSGNTQIRCDTQVEPLGEGCQYYALSYTWGDQSTGALITFNGALLPIAQNLCDALLRLRLIDQPRILWVDAVCINQLDNDEKSTQVALMGKIFQEATQVLIWLGVEENDSNVAMDFFNGDATASSEAQEVPRDSQYDPQSDHISKDGDRKTTAVIGNEYYDAAQKMDSRAIMSGVENLRRPLASIQDVQVGKMKRIQRAVFALVMRPWWERVWIIQECVLPKKDPIVLCGHRAFAWEALVRLDELDMLNATDVDDCLTGLGLADFVGAIFQIEGLRIMRESLQTTTSDFSWELESLFYMDRKTSATDPRDRVYGLLALTSEHCRACLPPDYSKSVAAVYVDAARFIISSTKSLQLLGTASNSHPVENPPLPSWVPAWDIPFPDRRGLGLTHNIYDASHGYSVDIKEGPDRAILEVEGLSVGVISDVSPVISGPKDSEEPIVMAIFQLRNFVLRGINGFLRDLHSERDFQLAGHALLMDPDPRESSQFWRTLVADSGPRGSSASLAECPAPDHFADLFEMLLQPYERDNRTISSDHSDQASQNLGLDSPRLRTPHEYAIPDSFMPGSNETLRRMKYLEPLLSTMRDTLYERRLFITKTARLGLGPRACKPGDKVAILFGAEVPMVLREQGRDDGAMRLVGQSYLHSVMRGEATAKLSEPNSGSEKRTTTFKLC